MLKGVILKLGSTLAFAGMGAAVKAMSPFFSIGQIVYFRSFFALILLVGWLRLKGDFPYAIYTRQPFGHLLRGLIGSGGMIFSFVAIALLPLPEATAISFLTPLLVVALAAILLAEKVQPYRWSAVAVGFLGVLVMLSDHLGEKSASNLGAGAALLAAVCAALAMIQTRRLTKTETTGAIVFYFSVLTACAGFFLMTSGYIWPENAPLGQFLRDQRWITPDWPSFAVLVAVGLFGGLGQILMTECFRYADASIIAPLDYTAMIWASALGALLFSEIPSIRVIVGSTLVIVAGLYVIARASRLERRRIQEMEKFQNND